MKTRSVKPATTKETQPALIRLNKFIAHAGVCSRRDADILIQQGKIKVNGTVITELGYKVNLDDEVKYQGKILQGERLVYVLLNKPKDFITTTDDPDNRKTVMQLVAKSATERIFPVGRLDRNTTGLLLFTNDGDLADRLSHPSHKVTKIYQAELNKPIESGDLQKLVDGVELDDGRAFADKAALTGVDNKTIGLEIHIGKNRIVRRMLEHLGYDVVRLDRIMYAGLTKKNLPRGKWRLLAKSEIIRLKHLKK